MPTLSYIELESNTVALEIVFNLTGLETHGTTTEGWLYYDLKLFRNGNELVSVDGTVHDNDMSNIESLLKNGSLADEEYEPQEPDFKFRVEDNDDERLVTCMINNGRISKYQTYDNAGIGICLPIEVAICVKFVEELRKQRLGLTNGLEFKDYN